MRAGKKLLKIKIKWITAIAIITMLGIGFLVVLSQEPIRTQAMSKTALTHDSNGEIPVYYLGSDLSIKSLFRNVINDFRSVNPSSTYIIVIDMRTVKLAQVKKVLTETLKTKLPPVLIIGTPEQVDSIMKLLGVHIYGIPIAVEKIVRGTKTVKPLSLIVYGFMPTGRGKGVTFSMNGLNSNLKSNVLATYRSMVRYISSYQVKGIPQPSVGISSQANYTYNACPYGKLNIWDIVGDLNDQNPNYHWRYYRFKSQMVPGTLACSSDWRNADVKEVLDADYYTSEGFLSDYSPTTTSGINTVTVGLSVSIQGDRDGVSPGVTLSVSWSYSIPDVVVHDQSDFSLMKAAWWHDINEAAYVGSNTYLAQPGAIIRLPEHGTYSWYTETIGQWAHKVCTWIFCHWELSGYYGYVVKWTVIS